MHCGWNMREGRFMGASYIFETIRYNNFLEEIRYNISNHYNGFDLCKTYICTCDHSIESNEKVSS